MNNHLNNLGDASPAMAELRTLLGGLKDHATLNLEVLELRRLVAEVKAESAWQMTRADDAEGEVRYLREQLRKSEARRRYDYAPCDANLVDTVRDLFPHEVSKVFGYLLHFSSPYYDCGDLTWKIERIRDACLAVTQAADEEGVA